MFEPGNWWVYTIYCDYLPEMDKYFGMYVPGNWWVYYDVLFFDDLNAKPFFAREIGIVQFIILTDTFSLIESHIQ